MRIVFKNNKGFTMVELMTVAAIIGIIAAIGAAGYRQGERRVILDNQAFAFMQDVRRAQELALSSRGTGAAAPGGYGIYLPPNAADHYFIYADQNKNRNYDSGEEVERISLDAKIVISNMQVQKNAASAWSVANFIDINYAAPDLTARITKGADKYEGAKIVFSVVNGSQTRTAAANIAGLIYVE